ncbi:MAG: hypothetical protein GY701_01110, partial [Sulfitobacter sp.]|nr:hypothetical protein [Sulfitobacter sp.]
MRTLLLLMLGFSLPGWAAVQLPGDIDGDGNVDRDDIRLLLTQRNQPANVCEACDIDGDGYITILDARGMVLLCSWPRCVTAAPDQCPDDPDKTEPGICGCGVADSDNDG